MARLGGEEFGVVLADTKAPGAAVMAERFRRSIEGHGFGTRALTVSVGVVTATPGVAPAELAAAADAALYRAKAEGRNRVVTA